jgi:hypothetical protein
MGSRPAAPIAAARCNVVLREHVLSSKRHNGAGHLTVFGVLVTKKHGPFVLRREYVVEEPGAHD